MINSYIIYSQNPNHKKLGLKEFKAGVIQELLGLEIENTSYNYIDLEPRRKRACILGSFGEGKQLDCAVCSERGMLAQTRRKRTSYFCKTCNIPVCVLDCYDKHLSSK